MSSSPPQGQKALQTELEHLETVNRREIAERIKTAREWGDLKENSEYHDAKNDQAHLETKILRHPGAAAGGGGARGRDADRGRRASAAAVEVEDAGSGRTTVYTLVSPPEAAPGEGKLSIDSPVGKALVGGRVGDTVTLETPRGVARAEDRRYRRLKRRRLSASTSVASSAGKCPPYSGVSQRSMVEDALGDRARHVDDLLREVEERQRRAHATRPPAAATSSSIQSPCDAGVVRPERRADRAA